jgi:hypothetical protein
MVVSTPAQPGASTQPPGQLELVESATDASIARYMASGERVYALMDTGWKVLAALGVLILVAWALGALPGAIKLI